MKTPMLKPKKKMTAQAMVEFALALPILLLVVYGLLETGRLLFMYASVVTAARQAARYGSASGDNGTGTLYYNDCAGIDAAANRVAFIQTFKNISIAWDTGPGSAPTTYCTSASDIIGTGHPINGDRITVSVTSHFSPIVPLVPFQGFDITSTDSRTLLVSVPIAVTPPPGSGGGGSSALLLSKSANPQTFLAAGDVITYTFTLTNQGTTALGGPFAITDSVMGSFNCGPASLDPTNSATCTRTYTITDPDVTAGFVKNTAQATDAGNSVISNTAGPVTVTLAAQPAITLAKAGTAPAIIDQGQKIQYTFTITNTGNVPLVPPYTISDPLIGSNWSCPSTPNPLPVGGTVVCTGTYTLVKKDIGGIAINNTATASAHYGAQTVTSPPASASVLIPELYLVLTVSPGSVTAVGQTVTYTYTFTNQTTSAMSGITVTDTRGANGVACLANLGAGATSTCTHTYVVTQADFDSPLGYFTNSATGTSSGKNATTSNVARVNVTVTQGPAITLTKTAAPVLTGPGQSFITGQIITYTYTIKNTGNVTITPTVAAPMKVTDSDARVAMAAGCTMTSGSLGPNATVSCTGSLTLTDSDIAAGTVTSTGTVNAMFGSTALTATSTYTLKTFYDARVSVIKTADKNYFTAAGDVITYSYSIKNTGGQAPLVVTTPYTLNDNKTGAVTCPNTAGKSLALGASIACNTATYTVTAADYAAGKVDNTATIVSGSTSPASTNVAGTAHVILLVCDATHPTSSPLSPIPSGSNTSWGILNNTGTDLHFAVPSGMTITWTGGNLQKILLGGASVWSGNQFPNGTISLNTVGWPAISYGGSPTLTTMAFTFGASASNIKVHLTFQEKAGNQCEIYSP